MLKHIYKGIILIVVFAVSLLFMGKNIREESFELNTTTKMSAATFPVVYMDTEAGKQNLLHGYSTNIDANIMRDNITLLDGEQSLKVLIKENQTTVKRLNYEVRDCISNELIDSGTISALEMEDDYKSAKIKVKGALTENTEYAVKITTITSTGKKIHFYTRVKRMDNSHLAEKVDFVTKLHTAMIEKDDKAGIASYLETDPSIENASLSYVTIKSSYDMVMWGKLKPTVITDITPRVTEMNQDTASIELKYMVEAETDTGKEKYYVTEFYRVKYTESRMYLLYFERHMEATFNSKLMSLKAGELKLGVSNEYDMNLVYDENETKLCFVRNRTLWYYDMITSKMVKVFSFEQSKADYIRDRYDQHNIRILNMDVDGNIEFVVYGYMNRGDYEGRTAIILYRYHSVDNRIEEQVYIPMDVPYQMLKEDQEGFSYVNNSGVFYFTLNDGIYSYNMITKSVETIVEGIDRDNIMIAKKDAYIAWTDSNELGKAGKVIVLDLETGKRNNIEAASGEGLRIFGSINDNLILGYVKLSDITEANDGSTIAPANKVDIMDKNLNLLKSYSKKRYYTVDTLIKDNVVELARVKKTNTDGAVYSAVDSDYILNGVADEAPDIGIATRVTDRMFTELYITLPKNIELEKKPDVEGTVNTVITEDTTLRLDTKRSKTERYYVYALGSILKEYRNAGEAITLADEKMGSVANQDFKIIWERGRKDTRASISGIDTVSTATLNSIKACVKMMLSYTNVSVSTSELADRNGSLMEILTEYMKRKPINLTGCNLDEVLYYVSDGKPVIAMKDATHAVLITAYDEFNITVYDPQQGTTWKEGYKDGAKLFERAGNVFISYLD
ncbi:MAG TPA: cysteine peptidase family C39 domain-containing protein [Lachnospiraceae bacterium]|nr:cysteine peptidase family C39 domain-containing protein [Lachnospiraceae bacterium]